MLWNCLLCVAALASLSLQYTSARPTSDRRKSASIIKQPGEDFSKNFKSETFCHKIFHEQLTAWFTVSIRFTYQYSNVILNLYLYLYFVHCLYRPSWTCFVSSGLTIDDPAGLQDLINLCRLNPDLCTSGGRVEGVTERLLHKMGLTRVQSHIMLQVLAACLEDADSCDTEDTVSAMIKVQQLSSTYKAKGGKSKRGKALRSLMPTIRHHTNVGEDIGLDTLYYMYSRHGRNGSSSVERKRRSISKRTIPSLFNSILRATCTNGKKCSSDDHANVNRDLPGNSEMWVSGI